MYKLTVEETKEAKLVRAKNMTSGQIGQITEGHYQGEFVLRIYDQIVSLTNPTNNWTGLEFNDNIPSFQIRLLPKGTTLTLTVGE